MSKRRPLGAGRRCSPAKSAVNGLRSSLDHLKLQVQGAGETATASHQHQHQLEATERHPQPRRLKKNPSLVGMMSGQIRLQRNMIHMI